METRNDHPPQNGLITEKVDIYKYPSQRGQSNEGVELTLGDLHGNVIKLLFFLIREGIMDINLDATAYKSSIQKKIKGKTKSEIYDELVNIYQKEPDLKDHPILSIKDLSATSKDAYKLLKKEFKAVSSLEKKDLKFFRAIIDGLIIKDRPKLIRLIGDEVCERANFSDEMIFRLIEKKFKEKISYEILESNHGSQFRLIFLKGLGNFVDKKTQEKYINPPYVNSRVFYETTIIFGDQSLSLQTLGLHIKKGWVKEAEINNIVTKCYLPNLKLISYSLTDSGIRIFTHAPVGFETLKGLAEGLGIDYVDETPLDLAHTIDEINIKFYKFMSQLNNYSYEEFLEHGASLKAPKMDNRSEKKGLNPEMIAYYYYRLIWNRDVNRQLTNSKNYLVEWGHGHDSSAKFKNILNSMCFDGPLGKNMSIWERQWIIDQRKEHAQLSLKSPESIRDFNRKAGMGDYFILRDDGKDLKLEDEKKLDDSESAKHVVQSGFFKTQQPTSPDVNNNNNVPKKEGP